MARGKLIDPTKFPVKSSDLAIDSMQASGDDLDTAGDTMVTAMEDIEVSWSRLPGVYVAPEAELVYGLMTSAALVADEVDEVFHTASGFLDQYTQDLRWIRVRLVDLETRAATFKADVEGGVSILLSQKEWASPHMSEQVRQDFQTARMDVNWWEDDATNENNTALLDEYDKICADILTASADCTASLRGLLSMDAQWGLVAMEQEAARHPHPEVSFEQPAWGYPGTTDRSLCESVSLGIINFGGNTINGIGGLIGFNTETGWSWDTAGQSWGGLGNLAGSLIVTVAAPVQVVNQVMKVTGNENGFTEWMDDRATVVRDTGAAIVGYDPYAADGDGWHKWEEDPTAMATEMGLNVLTCLIPGAEVAAGLKAGSWGAKAAKVAGEAAEVVLPGSSHLVQAGLTRIIGGADEVVVATGETAVTIAGGAGRNGLVQIIVHDADITVPGHQPSINDSIRPSHLDNPSITSRTSSDFQLPGVTKPHGTGTPHEVSGSRAPHDASRLYDDMGPLIHEPSAAERAAGQPVTPHETPATIEAPIRERELVGVGARPGDITNSVGTTTRPNTTTGTGGQVGPGGHTGSSGGGSGLIDTGSRGRGGGSGSGSGRGASGGESSHGDGPLGLDGADVPGMSQQPPDGWSVDPSQGFRPPAVAQVIEVSGKDLPGPHTSFASQKGLAPNTLYKVPGRGNFYTDASGTVRYVETTYGDPRQLNYDLHKPQPYVTYVVHPDIHVETPGVDHSHIFVTDGWGRTVLAHTDGLGYGDATRSGSVQSRIGGEGGVGYDGGHAFGKDFGGGAEYVNLKAQLAVVNRGAGDSFFNLEYEWRSILNRTPPGQIEVDIRYHYPPGGSVPDLSIVEYRVDSGPAVRRRFPNV